MQVMPRYPLIIAIGVLLCGCRTVQDERQIYGTYRLSRPTSLILSLEVRADHSFVQIVTDGTRHEQVTGTWAWDPVCLRFDGLLVLQEASKALPLTTMREETARSCEYIGGLCRVDACLAVENIVGEIRLVADPDRPEFYAKQH